MNKIKERKRTAAVSAVLALVFAAALVFCVIILNSRGEGKTACIYSDGKLVEKIDLDRLSEKRTIRIETESGGYNIIEAEPGRIHVTEASCPDKVCIRTGYISDSALPVSCLPNKLVVKIEGASAEGEPDIIVN